MLFGASSLGSIERLTPEFDQLIAEGSTIEVVASQALPGLRDRSGWAEKTAVCYF